MNSASDRHGIGGNNPPTAIEPAPLAYTMEEAARRAGIGRTTVYFAIRDGTLPSLKMGRSRRILHDDFIAWLRSHRTTTAA
jgi:excisionase family DNA binding protein